MNVEKSHKSVQCFSLVSRLLKKWPGYLSEFKLLTSAVQYQSDFRTLYVIVVEFQLHHNTTQYKANAWNDGFVRTPSADLWQLLLHRQNGYFTSKNTVVVLSSVDAPLAVDSLSLTDIDIPDRQ